MASEGEQPIDSHVGPTDQLITSLERAICALAFYGGSRPPPPIIDWELPNSLSAPRGPLVTRGIGLESDDVQWQRLNVADSFWADFPVLHYDLQFRTSILAYESKKWVDFFFNKKNWLNFYRSSTKFTISGGVLNENSLPVLGIVMEFSSYTDS